MKAAVIERLGGPPVVAEREAPDASGGRVLVDVLAATINPIDLAVAAGTFYGGRPDVPYVPGREGVGRRRDGGRLVRFEVAAGYEGDGSLAERAAVREDLLIELPDDADPQLAVCLGIAGLAGWLAVTERGRVAAGDRVLVLGASGAVGKVAVQAAKLRGAAVVVAAGRSEEGLRRARELGADTVVRLDGGPPDAVAARFREAAGGELDVVVDPLWGAPALAALEALRVDGRLVNLGASAGATLELPSAPVRGRMRNIVGHSNLVLPREAFRAAYLELLGHATAGRIVVDREALPLDAAPEAWRRQAASPHQKLVLVP